jgi:cytochrome c oxidase assembly protein subunit 19
MSFGRPPSINVGFKVTAPDRGSFPLDHYGECRDKMQLYMACLKENGSTSTPCRDLSRDYLDCRMNKGLMEKDEWKNLGLANVDDKSANAAKNTQKNNTSTST